MSSLPRPRAIVFDFDLTLVDSTRGFVESHQYASSQLGLPVVDYANAARSIGTALPVIFQRLFPGHESLQDEYIRLWQARADEVMTDLTEPLDGAYEAVSRLHEAGILLGIVSQKRRYRVEDVLRRDGMIETLAVVLGGDDLPDFKPDPRGLLMAIDRLGVTPAEAVYAGDTVIDAETARRAEVPFIAVLSGFALREDFAGHAPIAFVDSVAALPGLFGIE